FDFLRQRSYAKSIAHRFDRPDVSHNRSQILIGHLCESLVRHDWKQPSPVVTNAFTNGASYRLITPVARAGLRIRSDVGSRQERESVIRPIVSGASLVLHIRTAAGFPIDRRVTLKAMSYSFDEVLSALESRGRRSKFQRRRSVMR